MNVTRINLRGFMNHPSTDIALPKTGLVLVTGANGSGKSSMVEAVAWGLWGKTLRGTNPAPCGVTVHGAGHFHVKRTAGTKRVIEWTSENGVKLDWESSMEAQKGLERTVGDFDVWRRTHVFSSQDATHFTLATDAERKRLLEELLGLDRFDVALEACRVDLKAARVRLDTVTAQRSRVLMLLEHAEQSQKRAENTLDTLPPLPDTPKDVEDSLDALRVQRNALVEEKRAHLARAQMMDEAHGAAQGAYNAAARAVETLEASGLSCPACGQPWPDVEHKEQEILKARAALAAIPKPTRDRSAHDAVSAVEDKISAVITQGVALKHMQDERHRVSLTRRALEAQIMVAFAERFQHEETLDELHLEPLQSAVVELEAVEKVLGTKGVRAHILGQALGGLETLANQWLSVLGAGRNLSVKLTSYQAKKTGGVTESLGLEVVGAGGGHGYAGASGGERRRIDVALLLALADLSAAAFDKRPGTLFFDEVFDSLDVPGVRAVLSALHLLAQERVVVIISHSADLISEVDPVLQYHVEHGEVQKL